MGTRLHDTLLSEGTADLFLRTCLLCLLCVAASPSPLVLPLATIVAYQPAWLAETWAYIADEYGAFGVLMQILPIMVSVTYFGHGLFCLYFDSFYRPEALLQFKIQMKKGGLEHGRIPKVLYLHLRAVDRQSTRLTALHFLLLTRF